MGMRKRKWLGILLAFVLLAAAGCQAVGSVDLNRAILQMLDVESMEGSSSFTVEFTYDDKAEELEWVNHLNPLKLNLDTIKTESRDKASLAGSLEIPRGKIPFTASITPEELVFKPEGASKPFVLKLDELMTGQASAGGAMPQAIAEQQTKLAKELQAKFKDPAFLKPVYSYFVSGMPNPKDIKLSQVQETLGGESVSLYKVDAKLDGSELKGWIKSYLVKLMQDDQGLKALVAHLYDTLKPVLDESGVFSANAGAGASEMAGPGVGAFPMGAVNDMMESISGLMSDRETAIEVLHTEAKQLMVVILVLLNQPDHAQEQGNPLASLLSKDTYLKTSLYVDSSMKVRKSETVLNLAFPATADNPGLTGVKIKSVSSNWKVNQPVKADTIPAAGGLALGAGTQPADVLNGLDRSSILYQWLKDDLHVTRRTLFFFTGNAEFMPEDMRVYNENGVTMVPARYFADQLGAEVKWNADTQTVTLTDPGTGTVVQAAVDQETALVNGKKTALEASPALRDGVVYVPLRFAAEAFGGKVVWNAEHQFITVTID